MKIKRKTERQAGESRGRARVPRQASGFRGELPGGQVGLGQRVRAAPQGAARQLPQAALQ